MPAPSLNQLVRRMLVKNITMLTDVGDIPYDVIRPILLKIENPEQLVCLSDSINYRQSILEKASPQLCGADKELWISFIKRNVPNWKDQLERGTNWEKFVKLRIPTWRDIVKNEGLDWEDIAKCHLAGWEEEMLSSMDPKSWWRVYKNMRQEYEEEAQKDAAKLKAAFRGIKSEKNKHQSRMMDGVPHIPKLDGMQYAHAADYNRIKKPPKDTRPMSTVLSFRSGSKTKVLTGKGVLDKARREAKELSHFTARSSLSTPTHQLKTLSSKVLVAPPHRVEDFRKPAAPEPLDPSTPKPAMFVPPRRRVEAKDQRTVSGKLTLEERERRLRDLKNSSNATTDANRPSIANTPVASDSASLPLSNAKSASSIQKPLPTTSIKSSSRGLKRKAEDSTVVPSLESANPQGADSHTAVSATPPRSRVPKLSPEAPAVRMSKKKA
ncbi:MAG: hypothetical protein Q9201_006002, partial [Fulgogasparrea decipioides]